MTVPSKSDVARSLTTNWLMALASARSLNSTVMLSAPTVNVIVVYFRRLIPE